MGKIIINNNEIKRVFSGNKEIYNIYRGNTQIWQNFKMVDLGLPSGTLWADRNLGAKNIEDYGNVYSWGDLNNTTTDDWDNYMCSVENCGDEQNDPLVKNGAIYQDEDGEWFGDISGREFDATINQGNEEWRLPTYEEVDELISYCKLTLHEKTIIQNNVSTKVIVGISFTGLPVGENNITNTITIPILNESNIINGAYTLNDNTKHGYYWTGTINSGNVKQAYSYAFRILKTGSPAQRVGMCVSSRFRHLAIRPVKSPAPIKATIKFIDPESNNDTEITSVSLYKGESTSLYFKIFPELTSIKKVNFSSSNENIVTVTNTGYITAVNTGSTIITATLPNNEFAICNVTVKSQIGINKIILNDKNNQPIPESSTNNISITLNQWESMWIVPSLINTNNTSEGIVDKRLKWEVTSGIDKVFIVALHDMGIYWENTIPSNYEVHPVKIFGLCSGTAKITITSSANSSKKAYINVTVNENTNKCKGHTYVDLGIPGANYWSTENVGASNYNDVGGYYAWGESVRKDNDLDINTNVTINNSKITYTDNNHGYIINNYSNKLANGVIEFLGKEIYNTQYDTAKNIWGGHWRMPNYQEFNLISHLNDAVVKINNINYILKMGLNNDNFILIPKNGYKNTEVILAETIDEQNNTINYYKYKTHTTSECYYWTSTCKLNEQPSSNSDLNIAYEYNTGYGFINYVKCKGGIQNGAGVRAIYVFDAPYITYIGYENNVYKYVISHDDSNITIYYTIDESDPKTNGILYNGIITSNTNNITIRAVAKDSENNFSKESTTEPTYVDLGLPSGIKWCTHNIGATTFEQIGNFYKLARTNNSNPSISNNIIYLTSGIAPIGSYDGSFTSNQNCDPATILNNNINYCTPTHEQFQELVENCTFIYTKININGIDTFIYKVVGPNGNYIYLPFTSDGSNISLMISNHINNNSNSNIIYNAYAKFAKTFKSDEGILWHNLGDISRTNENESNIRPIYIGDEIQNNRNNVIGTKNVNVNNIYTRDYTPINNDDIEYEIAGSSLNDIITNSWSQMYPSGISAPKYKFSGGSHYGVGGCMAMASCQTMWYHKWPVVKEYKNATNTFKYRWNQYNSNSISGTLPIYIDATGRPFRIPLSKKDQYYTISEKRIYHYNDMLKHYFTCPYQNMPVDTKVVPTYSGDMRRGMQYNYKEALEYGNFLLEFAQMIYETPSSSNPAGIVSLNMGPYETVGSSPNNNKSMQYYYNYDKKKQFALGRNMVTKSIFKEIVLESLNNCMPITSSSHGHAWMITGYDPGTDKFYINMNEGDGNTLLQDIDRIKDTSKEYSYIYLKSNGEIVATYTASTQIGISPTCTKSIKDYFLMYVSTSTTKTNSNSVSKSIYTYCNYIKKYENGTTTGNNKYGVVVSFAKTDKIIFQSADYIFPKGNAIPERIYAAICLENVTNTNLDPVILKKIWYVPTPSSGYSSGTSIILKITSNDNISFSDLDPNLDPKLEVPNGTYYLTIRYSKDDGLTYSERVILPDTKERELLTVEVTDTTVTITPTYKTYGENYI